VRSLAYQLHPLLWLVLLGASLALPVALWRIWRRSVRVVFPKSMLDTVAVEAPPERPL